MAGVGCTYSLTQIAIQSVSCHANASGFFGVSDARQSKQEVTMRFHPDMRRAVDQILLPW